MVIFAVAGGGSLPTWLSIVNGVLQGTPLYPSDVNIYRFTMTTSDEINTITTEVTLTISNCYYRCSSCDGADMDECTSCATTFFLHNYFCWVECPEGSTPIGPDLCASCDPKCELCYGISSTECTKCTEGNYILGNSCRSSCPNGYYGSDELRQCLPCDDYCITCFGPSI